MNWKAQRHCLLLISFIILLLLNLSASAQGLKVSGKKIVNDKGKEVILRGMGLGGWMLQEPYMMELGNFAGTQWQIKELISSLIGPTNTEVFYDAWHENHCTRHDIDSLASWGFNSVRLPMHYNLFTLPIENEPVQGVNTWLEKGFALTDSLISWCKANQMYVILDLHAAPGGQGKDAAICDGNSAKPSLWESAANRAKTVALWKKLAERYANEPWVGAYDVLNEPNWSFTAGGNQNGCSENSNAPLRQLYIDITSAIRQVDTKHIIIIEGNCWGNNYNGIYPDWDDNLVLSFHKYWSNNDQGSIAGIVGLRDSFNMPIWLGESGENSNAWFTDAIKLVEKNGIGWAWWPLKKINSVVDPLTIVKTDGYQTLLNYWQSGGTKPSVSFATNVLMEVAQNANIKNCIYHPDVIDAMFRQVNDTTTIPFTNMNLPRIIPASDYDLGLLGQAYFDTDVADYHVSSGTYTEWNSGGKYRNDGVDIDISTDTDHSSNDYYVGWTADNEWLQYTVNVDSAAAYQLSIRYASQDAGSKIKVMVNGGDVTGSLSLPATGGYDSWSTYSVNDVILNRGQQKIKMFFIKGGANIRYLDFALQKKTEDVSLIAVSAETYHQTELIYLSCNKSLVDTTLNADDFTCMVNGNAVEITSLALNPSNPMQIVLGLAEHIYDIDDIKLTYTGGKVTSTDGTLLTDFSNMPVVNNLPVYATIPGKIEAESFTVNQGLVPESSSDAGGGFDLGYTSTGDYLDFRIWVLKTSKYTVQARIACYSTAGKIEFQQINALGSILNSVQLSIPVTSGWQTWQTVGTTINLTEGICTLRVKVIQPEFNMNWFNFFEYGIGIDENASSVFTMYPNPATDEVSILIPGSTGMKKKLLMFSANGMVLKQADISESEVAKKLVVSDLPKGLYLVEINMAGKAYRNKLVVQ